MNNKYLFCIVLLSFCFASCKSISSDVSQKCTLVFKALEKEITADIYRPIDDCYNASYISDRLLIKPNKSVSYELDVSRFAFVKCQFSNGKDRVLLLEPGDCIEISCTPQATTLSGSNAEGQNYYKSINLSSYMDIIAQHLTKVPIDYDSIFYYFQQELVVPYQLALEKMEASGSVTPTFSSILAKDLHFACCAALQITYNQWITFKRNDYLIKDFKPCEEDIHNMLLQLSQLYETPYALEDDSKKMPHNFISEYYVSKYNYLDDEAKEKLMHTEGYDKDCGYPYLLLASDNLQLRYFGEALLYAVQSKTSSINKEKLLIFLSGKFTDSEYVAIIEDMMIQQKSSKPKK